MSSLIDQTALRQTENRMIQRITNKNNLHPPVNEKRKKGPAVGSTRYIIFRDAMSVPTMKYIRRRNQSNPCLPNLVLEFCCDKVLPMLINKKSVKCFTEHNRFDDNTNTNYLFGSNPSYRSDTGQLN